MSEHECYMQDKIESIEKKVDKVLDALCGNEIGNKGIVSRIEAVEKDINDFKVIKWKIAGMVSGISLFVSALVYIITKFL